LRVGAALFQLGGPDSLDHPDIVDFPLARIARQPLPG
jgi:hypothetical protein